VPGIELTGADNRFDLSTTTIFWNPSVTTAAGGAQPWDKFPPLVALAHELVHAYQRIVEDKTTYASSLQIPAIKEASSAMAPPRAGLRGHHTSGVLAYRARC
jgi:hypothetical protein